MEMHASPVVLLVEDDPDDAELTLRALKKCNLANRIEVVRDGAAALDYIFAQGAFANRSQEDKPALVLLDLHLPKVGGLEVLQRIRSDDRSRDMIVVILTSSDSDEDIVEGYRLFANSYIQKPVDFKAFVATVEQVGLYWLVLNKALPA